MFVDLMIQKMNRCIKFDQNNNTISIIQYISHLHIPHLHTFRISADSSPSPAMPRLRPRRSKESLPVHSREGPIRKRKDKTSRARWIDQKKLGPTGGNSASI